jgi:fibronectin-binding autotransporter adhesin
VTVDGQIVVGCLDFDNSAASYTIAGPNAITLQTSSGIPAINVTTGYHTVSTQIILTSNTNISVASNSMMNISGNLTGIGGGLNKMGDGTLILSGSNSYTGITNVSSGTIIADSSSALGSPLSGTTIQNSATLDLNSQNLATEAITVNGSGASGDGAIVNNGSSDQTDALRTVALGNDASFGGIKRWDIYAPSSSTAILDLATHTLTKVGNNRINLVNTNVSDGNIIVSSGILGLQAGSKVLDNGTGTTIRVDACGTLDIGAAGNPGFSVTRHIVMNGGTLINNDGGTTYLSSSITMNASSTNTISTLNRLYIQGNISGSGSVNKSAGGLPLYLTGNNSSFTGTWNQSCWMTYFSTSNSGSPCAAFIIHSSSPDVNPAILCTTTSGLSVHLGSLSGDSGFILNRDLAGANGTSSFIIGENNASTVFNGIIVNNLADALGSGSPNTGTISIQKVGIGTQILTGSNLYTGPTLITSGKLYFNNSSALIYSTVAGDVTVNSGSLLGGNGTIYRNVLVNTGGSIEAGGSNGVGVFTLNNLTLGAQSTDNTSIYVSNVDTSNTLRAIINVNNNVTANARTTINVSGILPTLGQHKLLGYGALNLVGKTFNDAFVLGTTPSRMIANLVNNTGAKEIDLNVQHTDYPIWTGSVNANWDGNDSNWVLASNTAQTTYIEGDNVVFNDMPISNYSINLSGMVLPTYVSVDNSSHNYSFSGSGSIGGSGGLNKTGTGSLTINTVNSFSGDVAINGGTIVASTIANMGTASALGKGLNISFDNGSLNYTGDSALTNRSVTLNANGGTIAVNNPNTTLAFNSAYGLGGLTKYGMGKLVFNYDNSYSGLTTINNGTLEYSGGLYNHGAIASSAIVNNGADMLLSQNDIFGKYLTLPLSTIILNQGGLVENGGSGTNSYFNTFNDLTFAGGELRVNGGFTTNWQACQLKGTVTVAGAVPSHITVGSHLYNYLTQVQIGNNTANGSTTFDVADVTGNADSDLTITPALSDGRDSSANVVASRLIKTGQGTLLLAGCNTYSGGTTIVSGTIQVGNRGTSGTIGIGGDITINTNANLIFSRNSTVVLSSTLNGSGTITQNGSGSIVLTNNNSNYTGALNLNGPLTIANDNALGAVTAVQTNNSNIKFGSVGLNEGTLNGWDTTNIPILLAPTVNFYKYLNGNQIGLNQTVVYQGKVYLTTGQWSFVKQYNMYAYLNINGQTILNNTDNMPSTGSIAINRNDWYSIDLRVGNAGSLSDPTLSWPFGIGVKQGSAPVPLSPTGFEAFDEGAAGISLHYDDNSSFYVGNNFVVTGQNIIDTNGLGTGSVTLYGDIGGSGGLTKTGSSNLYLTGNLSYTGDTYVEAGTLDVQALTTSVNITIGPNASLSASRVCADTLTLEAGATVTIKPIPGGPSANQITPVPEPIALVHLTIFAFGLIAAWNWDNSRKKE